MAYGGYKVVVEGILAADPEVRAAGKGSVLNARLAHKATIKQGDRYEDSETTWFSGQMWQRGNSDQELRNIAASLHKGDRVVVVGTAFAEAWESRAGKSGVSNILEIESISPSLRWAEAQVVKNERGAGTGSGGGQSWGGQAQGQSGWGKPAPAAAPAADSQQGFAGGFDDEQPF